MRRALAAALLALPCLAAAQGYPRTPAEYLKLMDADGDGVLEPEELPGGRGKPVTLRSHQDNLRRQFHKLDRNHDGYLDAKELAAPPA